MLIWGIKLIRLRIRKTCFEPPGFISHVVGSVTVVNWYWWTSLFSQTGCSLFEVTVLHKQLCLLCLLSYITHPYFFLSKQVLNGYGSKYVTGRGKERPLKGIQQVRPLRSFRGRSFLWSVWQHLVILITLLFYSSSLSLWLSTCV